MRGLARRVELTNIWRRSLKDTIKALKSAFAAPHLPNPISAELSQELELFVTKHETIDEHDSQRLHDGLLEIYRDHVEGDTAKVAPFVGILLQLRPVIKGTQRLLEWWDVAIRPIVETVGHTRRTVDQAAQFVQSILDYDVDEDHLADRTYLSSILSAAILQRYTHRTSLPALNPASSENEFVISTLATLLVNFGRKKPKVIVRRLLI